MPNEFPGSAAGQGHTDSGAAGSGALAGSQGQDNGGAAAGTDANAQGAAQGGDVAGAVGAQQGQDAGAAGSGGGQQGQQGQQVADAGAQAHWSESMPEAWREVLKGFENPEAAQKALERGAAYQPASKPEDVALTYPDGMEPDKAQADRFRALAVETGLTPKQCQALLDWQLKESADAYAAAKASGEKALRDAWGNSYEANGMKAMQALTALDRRMNGELAPAIASIGGADNPVIIKALYTIGTLIGEDTLAGASAAASAPNKEMSTEDFYAQEVFGKKE